ncbi:MAG: PD-(D/E)XK nuclease-like domain-containing protein [Pirellulales bacterium]
MIRALTIADLERPETALGICATEGSITADAYHALPGVSNSRLKVFMEDPRKYFYRFLSGQYVQPQKDCFDFGSAVHDLALLGTDAGIVCIPDEVLTSNGSRSGNKWKDFAAANAGSILLKRADYQAVLNCVNAVLADPVAGAMLLSPGVSEKLFQYEDSLTELTLRCRPDRLVQFNGVTVVPDLKTTPDTTASSFAKSIVNFGYHYQAYFYRKVLKACGIDTAEFVFIAVGTEPPHTVDCYVLDEEFMRIAETDVENSLADLAERTRHNNWKSHSHGSLVRLSPPRFAKYAKEYTL